MCLTIAYSCHTNGDSITLLYIIVPYSNIYPIGKIIKTYILICNSSFLLAEKCPKIELSKKVWWIQKGIV